MHLTELEFKFIYWQDQLLQKNRWNKNEVRTSSESEIWKIYGISFISCLDVESDCYEHLQNSMHCTCIWIETPYILSQQEP